MLDGRCTESWCNVPCLDGITKCFVCVSLLVNPIDWSDPSIRNFMNIHVMVCWWICLVFVGRDLRHQHGCYVLAGHEGLVVGLHVFKWRHSSAFRCLGCICALSFRCQVLADGSLACHWLTETDVTCNRLDPSWPRRRSSSVQSQLWRRGDLAHTPGFAALSMMSCHDVMRWILSLPLDASDARAVSTYACVSF